MIRLILVLLVVLIYLIIGIFLQLGEAEILGKFNKPLKDLDIPGHGSVDLPRRWDDCPASK